MSKDFIAQTASEINEIQKIREAYKKHFWIYAQSMDNEQRKSVKKLFIKIDRLRNHLKLWLKHLASKRGANYNNYKQLIKRSKIEIHASFKQLDKALYNAT